MLTAVLRQTTARGLVTTAVNTMSSASAAGGGAVGKKRPLMYVFDLDGCVWDPEMYQLWGGGAPFAADPQREGDLLDCKGTKVYLMADVRRIWRMLHEDPAYADARVAVASCCDEPGWADECLSKFTVAPAPCK